MDKDPIEKNKVCKISHKTKYDAIFKKTVKKEDEKESSEDKASTKDD